MELLDVIKKRRSIRKYQKKDVSWDQISEVLDAARYAPAAGNVQSTRFIVIRDKEKIESIAKSTPGQEWLSKAPVVIVACGVTSKLHKLYGDQGENNYAYQNAAASIQTGLLRAQDLGLAACWVAAFDDKKLSELLDIPKDAKPMAIIPLGYASTKPLTPIRDPLNTLVYFEKWEEKERPEIQSEPFSEPIKRSLDQLRDFLDNIKIKKK